jgi:hypothetical protein
MEPIIFGDKDLKIKTRGTYHRYETEARTINEIADKIIVFSNPRCIENFFLNVKLGYLKDEEYNELMKHDRSEFTCDHFVSLFNKYLDTRDRIEKLSSKEGKIIFILCEIKEYSIVQYYPWIRR